MNPVKLLVLIAQVLMVLLRCSNGQVPMSRNPSFHRISYRVGPDGQTDMGGHGRELDRFFNGLGSGGSGFRNGRANSGGMFRRRRMPIRRWGFYRTF